jgi:Uncharacterized protein conserved in bacteria
MDKAKTQKVTFRIFAVIVAVILWMYVTAIENPQRQITVSNIPVKIVNEEALAKDGFVIIGDINNFSIDLMISGSNKDVLAVKQSDFKVEANMASMTHMKGSNSVLVDIKDWPKDINIPNQPFYVTVELDDLVQKNFPVTLRTNIKTKDGYAAVTGSVKPPEVILRGASRYIGSVASVVASVEASDVSSDIVTSVPIQVLDKNGVVIAGITDINPKTVDVAIPVKRAKDVPVNVKQSGKLPNGIFMKGAASSPATVKIIGDEKTINNIKSLDTEPVTLDDVTVSTTKQAKLVLPQGITLADPNNATVNVNISVEGTVQKSFSVPVSTANLPAGLNAEVLDKTIIVTVSGQSSAMDKLTVTDIKAVVDLAAAVEGENQYAIKITVPDGFDVRESNPPKVKVKITKTQ